MWIEQVKNNISNLYVSKSEYAEKEEFVEMHLHDEAEFIKVYSGSMSVFANNTEYILTPGDIMMINRNVPHSTHLSKGIITGLLQIRIEKFIANNDSPIFSVYCFVNENKNPLVFLKKGDEITNKIDFLLTSIISEYSNNKTGNDIFINGYAHQLVGTLYRYGIAEDYFSKISKKSIEKIVPVLEYIEENYSKQITLDELGNIMHLNPEYLSRKFKKTTSKNIFEYLNYVRIENSKKLLSNTDLSVLDVACEVGYNSISYFYRCFVKNCGCSPSVYRKIKSV